MNRSDLTDNMIQMGVDAIITDDPASVKTMVAEHNKNGQQTIQKTIMDTFLSIN